MLNKRKRPSDPNRLVHSILQDIISISEPQPEKNAAAVALSKLGASKGGKARAAALSGRKRAAIARKAAQARWKKNKS
jgi:ABC-type phosphate/phosphonate transport system ATPase subunit